MRVVVLTREGRDYSRSVNEWTAEFARRTGRELLMMDPDSREGEALAGLYGVMEYPTILALQDDGRVLESWRGAVLPTISEVGYYARD